MSRITNLLALNGWLDKVRVMWRKNPEWRVGQVAFNGLLEEKPELAELIRGTDFDPFHAAKVEDERYQRFMRLMGEVMW